MKIASATKPIWFRHLSVFQTKAICGMRKALVYDIDESDVKNISARLLELGLEPLVSKSKMLKILMFSQGDVFAFLYFLMEAYYKSNKPDYTFNEKLLLSAICYLDLNSTLKELDRILPKQPKRTKPVISTNGTESSSLKRSGPKEWNAILVKESDRKKPLTCAATSRRYSLERSDFVHELPSIIQKKNPYAMKIPRPVLPKLKSKITCSKYVVSYETPFIIDERYENRNKANYWFVKYKFNTKRSMVLKIINDEVSKLFEQIDLKTEPKEVLCRYHANLKFLQKQEYIETAKKNMEKVFNFVDIQKEALRERIRNQIERDVDFYLREFNEKWNYDKDLMPVNKDSNCSVCLLWKNDQNRSEIDLHKISSNSTTSNFEFLMNNINQCIMSSKCTTNLKNIEKLKEILIQKNQKKNPSIEDVEEINDPEENCCLSRIKNMKIPYEFNIEDSFQNSDPVKTINVIRNAAKRVIIEDLSISDSTESNLENLKLVSSLSSLNTHEHREIFRAIDKFIQTIFRKHLEVLNMSDERRETIQREKEQTFTETLDYGLDYYDPNDTKLMDKMLKEAFQIMAKNPRFVLASLPDSHELDILRVWIRKRYGKRYLIETEAVSRRTADEVRLMAEVYNKPPALIAAALKIKKPVLMKYTHHDEIMKLSCRVKHIYHERLREMFLEESRMLWGHLMSYRFTDENITRIFDSYLPSSKRDV